jgi:HK97 family phage major capsid protein
MNKWQKIMNDAFKKMEDIRKKAESEKRAMTAEEIEERNTLKAEIEAADAEMRSVEAEEELRKKLFVDDGSDDGGAQTRGIPIEIPDQPIYRGSPASQLGQQLLDIRALCLPGGQVGGKEVSEARSRLEQTEKRNATKMAEQAKKEGRAAATGGFTIGTPSDGGYFLQGETAIDLMTNGFNNSVVLPRTQSRTLGAGTQYVEVMYLDETSRATGSRGGGVRVYTTAELEAMTASKTKFRKIRIEPKKLTGLYYASGEMVRNITFLGQEMRQLFGEEFAFKAQDLVINGTGAGEPLGILNAGCLVTVTKETSQAVDTIVADNILKMESRLLNENPGVCYLVNRETKPQLGVLSIAVGTGGQLVPMYQQQFYQGTMQASLNGFPCFTIEQAAALGDAGDIILADFSKYITANKGDINEAMSIHVNFIYDQDTFRFIYYFDGQPILSSAITPYKGSATVSPFVVIGAR